MASRYKTMSDEELKELAKQRTKKTGCFSRVALAAQKELWERTHWDTVDVTELDDFADRDICDLQYNG